MLRPPGDRRIMSQETNPHDVSSPTWLRRWVGPLALYAWSGLVVLWLLDITGRFAGASALGRWLLPLALLALGVWGGQYVASWLAPPRRTDGLLLLGVLLVAIVVGFAGLGYEVGKGYYTDEGHYLHHARRLLSGELFVRTMIYPHLLYHLDAFALWLAELHPGASVALTSALYGVGEGPDFDWLVLRLVAATLGVATVVPIFLVARRLAGRPAALLASAAMIFSAHYHDGFQVNICDVPSASFAAFCLLVVERLARRETTRRYLLAGGLAGLAAATKYPAGMVAVAIAGVWVVQRWRQRSCQGGSRWGLPLAALVSMAVFLLSNPSLFVYPEETLWGPRGIFFGVRQYGQGGWIGVMPSSNGLYYLRQLAFNFGWPSLALAVPGLVMLDPGVRRRLLVLAPFPIAYLLLISSMSMVVVRNLFPVIPALAIGLGVALAAWWPWLAGLWQRRSRTGASRGPALVVASLWAIALLPPALRTGQQTLAMTHPSTRELMSDWIYQHVPRGAGILKESYTPNFAPVWFGSAEQRFLIRFPAELLDDQGIDYALLADHAHGRFFRPEHQTVDQARWYEAFFARHVLVHEVAPTPFRRGPHLQLYRLAQDLDPVAERHFEPNEAFLPNAAMAQGRALHFAREGQFALFRTPLRTGRYRLTVTGRVEGGRLEARDLDNRRVAEAFFEGPHTSFDWPEDGKAFLYLYLGAESRVEGVELEKPLPTKGIVEPSEEVPAREPATN